MAKREKVILFIMALVGIFGTQQFLSGPASKNQAAVAGAGVAETNKFIADVASSFLGDTSKTNLYIIEHGQADWTRDPFWHTRVQPEARTEAVAPVVEKTGGTEKTWFYSGYLEMGQEKLAIISGAEYEAGDELSRGGPVVKSINPGRVVIGTPGTAEDIILPLKETR